jgi:hypothetical protein
MLELGQTGATASGGSESLIMVWLALTLLESLTCGKNRVSFIRLGFAQQPQRRQKVNCPGYRPCSQSRNKNAPPA